MRMEMQDLEKEKPWATSRKIFLKLTLSKGKIVRYSTKDRIRRISSKLRHVHFKKAYIKVSYGKRKCNLGCVCEFYNDGEYFNPQEADKALKFFWSE